MKPETADAAGCDAPPASARPIIVDLSELTGLTWRAIFGNDRPVELEIGTGKGSFLLRRAQAVPEHNFFGIEWSNEFFRHAADRLRRWKMTNVRILRTDAAHFIRVVSPRASLHALHVYHPDPWPKTRHHKRRLFQRPFVEAAAECLIPGGRIAVQTDHAEYFAQIAPLLRSVPLLREAAFDDARFGVEGSRLATNFEVKYAREGRRFYQLAMERRDS